MTHEEACSQLRDDARRFTEGEIGADEWFNRVSWTLIERFPGDPLPVDATRGEIADLVKSSHTSTPPGTQPRVAGRISIPHPGRGAARGGS